MRFSHRSYAGKGTAVAVFRCVACGTTSSAPLPKDAAEEGRRVVSRKPLIDEGPPPNPVLGADVARRLLDG